MPPILRRTPAIDPAQPIGVWRQIFLVLKLMLSTGVFVGIGIAVEVAGAGIISAVTLAALLALVNQGNDGRSIARIDAENPLIYADWQYFIADWTLFLARLTAVATAVLGIAGYLLQSLQLVDPIWLMPTALVVMIALMGISFSRLALRLNSDWMAILVVIALLALIFAGLPEARLTWQNLPWQPWRLANRSFNSAASLAHVLQAAALMSMAYVYDQNQTAAPPAIRQQAMQVSYCAIVLAGFLYLGVASVSLGTLEVLRDSTVPTTVLPMAPLASVIQTLPIPGGIYLIALGAVAAMAGMAVDLLPKLARTALELSDNPTVLSRGQALESRLSPRLAKLLIGIVLGCIVLSGNMKTIWSFSAFTFLLHTALQHWITLRQHSAQNSCWRHRLGCAACLFLAFWVDWDVWLVSLGLVTLALIWRGVQYWSEEP
jgi:APA family basic amino acid/polyamine antiporter